MQPKKFTRVEKDFSDYYRKMSARVKALRIEAGYDSQEKFSAKADISRNRYQTLESEEGADIRFSTIIKICETHGLTLKEFFSEGF